MKIEKAKSVVVSNKNNYFCGQIVNNQGVKTYKKQYKPKRSL